MSVTYFTTYVREPKLLCFLWWLFPLQWKQFFLFCIAYQQYATRMYYVLMTPCLLIWNLDFGLINSRMDSLLRGDERVKSFRHAGSIDFSLNRIWKWVQHRGNLSHLVKGCKQKSYTQQERKFIKVLSKEKQLSSPVTDDLVTKGISVIESCLWVIASSCNGGNC